jgi:outer membrane protein OmpA-like peptidoglycan-associated protein
LDSADACPAEPEDRDGFDDADGCPETDNDRDAILDTLDQCPLEAEDKDGFQDDDGCPDPDNDADGIPDATDKCPLEAEDKDGFQDDDGCPDPDNDSDGILDATDECPLEAETVNGREDDDGCPDLVRVDRQQGRILILEKIYFKTNSDTILERSFPMLEEMAATLGQHQDLGKVSIEGHTDAKGSAASNLRLSQRRANSVMRFLVERGVAADRLSATGYGETKPLQDNKTEEGRAENRRVEFRLIDFVAPEADFVVPEAAVESGGGSP